RHERSPGERRQRAQPRLARPEHVRPGPGEDVVERRRGLAAADARQHVAEPRLDEPDRDRLVEPVALHAERGEAQDGSEHREGRERLNVTGPHGAQLIQGTMVKLAVFEVFAPDGLTVSTKRPGFSLRPAEMRPSKCTLLRPA